MQKRQQQTFQKGHAAAVLAQFNAFYSILLDVTHECASFVVAEPLLPSALFLKDITLLSLVSDCEKI
jgi:hypothetical protein